MSIDRINKNHIFISLFFFRVICQDTLIYPCHTSKRPLGGRHCSFKSKVKRFRKRGWGGGGYKFNF